MCENGNTNAPKFIQEIDTDNDSVTLIKEIIFKKLKTMERNNSTKNITNGQF